VHPHLRIVRKQSLKQAYDLMFGYRILKEAGLVVALNKLEIDQFKGIGIRADRIKVIPTGIDLAKYQNLPQKGTFRAKHGIVGTEKVILFLGRVHQSKGIDLLVEAFAELVKDLSGTKLIIAGEDDGFLKTLKKLVMRLKIEDKVLFTGRISGKDKISAYIDADVFVTPSFYGFPATFLEAWACSIPVVTTLKGSFIDEIDGKAGFVVQYNKTELRDALLKLTTDERLRTQFGQNGRELVEKCHDWDPLVKVMEQSYYDVVK
ncbi:MAG: glycosyltransferase, partial [Candidatus Hodarchaeota archaeon]